MAKSLPVRQYIATLERLAVEREIPDTRIAKIMGWKSPRTIANKFKGERDMKPEELQKLCHDVFGMTLIDLAAVADDLVLTRTPEAVYAARDVDSLPLALRQEALESIAKLKARAQR